MKKLLLHIAFITFSLSAFCATYETLTDGNWTDNTTVWSTDGVNPCGCFPGTIITGNVLVTGDTIIIKHNIIQDATLELSANTLVTIHPAGSLETTMYITTVIDSNIEAFGNMTSKKLTIGPLSQMHLFTHATLFIATRLIIEGDFSMISSYVYVDNGNIIVTETGMLDMTGGANIYFDQGNLNNFGLVNVCATCCVQVSGNVKNEITGTVTGEGAICSINGNFQNVGNWSNNVNWCAAGTDFGMPIPENCANTTAICVGDVLPVELASFIGTPKRGYNEIEWVTLSELNCDYYLLERSTDGMNWEVVSEINCMGTTQETTEYSVNDIVLETEKYYYRLWQFDINHDRSSSEVIYVESLKLNTASVFPNPNNGEFTLLLGEVHTGTIVSIYDLNGNEVYKIEDVSEGRMELSPTLGSGVYQLILNVDGKTESIKFVVL